MSINKFKELIIKKKNLLLSKNKLDWELACMGEKTDKDDFDYDAFDDIHELWFNLHYDDEKLIDGLVNKIKVMEEQIAIFSKIKKINKRDASGNLKLFNNKYLPKKNEIKSFYGYIKFYNFLIKKINLYIDNSNKIKEINEEIKEFNKKFENNLHEKVKDVINEKFANLTIIYGNCYHDSELLDSLYISYDYLLPDGCKCFIEIIKEIDMNCKLGHCSIFCKRKNGKGEINDKKWWELPNYIDKLLNIDNFLRVE